MHGSIIHIKWHEHRSANTWYDEMENVVYIKGTDGIPITIAECSIELIQDDTQPIITQFLD